MAAACSQVLTPTSTSVRGPKSRSGSGLASMRRPSPSSLRGRRVGGGLSRLAWLGEIGLGDPAGLDPSLHDQLFRIVTGDLDAVERTDMLGRLAAFLALGPADQIVGGAAREVIDRLDV